MHTIDGSVALHALAEAVRVHSRQGRCVSLQVATKEVRDALAGFHVKLPCGCSMGVHLALFLEEGGSCTVGVIKCPVHGVRGAVLSVWPPLP